MDRISKINIEGGFYNLETSIDLKTKENHRVSIIYGGNGTGKSSIANALLEYK